MKILIDPIYTHEVNRCASAVKMRKVVEHLLATTDDVFFYWLVPEQMLEDELEWLPKDDRILYQRMPYYEDRLMEYWLATKDPGRYTGLVHFTGKLWDIDLVLTNRTSMVPTIKWLLHKPNSRVKWGRRVYLIEDMPVMGFKKFVPKFDARFADLATLNGYVNAHHTYISAFWEKAHIIEAAKKFYAPALVKQLAHSITEATHVKLDHIRLKSRETILSMLRGERKFTISYAGRMVNRDFVDDSFEAMQKNWIIGGDKVRTILCTVSNNFGRVDHELVDHIEVFRPNREQFWKIMHEESDVGVFMSRDEDYSMVMMEPLMHGTPLVIYKADHSVASVGADYPFFCSSVEEGAVLLRRFQSHYAEMYEAFARWAKGSLEPLLLSRNEVYIPDLFAAEVMEFRGVLRENLPRYRDNEVVQLTANLAPKDRVVGVAELLEEAGRRKLISSSTANKMRTQEAGGKRLAFASEFSLYKYGLMAHGFKEAGAAPGSLVWEG